MGKGQTRIRNRIRELRFAAGEMTQAELADRIGVTRQTVIAMEQGRYSPSLEVAFRTAIALNAGLEDVFQYGEPSGAY
ncbi:MAG: helix-turn-helix transcriptional regulator [Maricaulaceae bacterium]|nr:helix-turn-helix transcriptional regulator [Maricaulaceae bacterium]